MAEGAHLAFEEEVGTVTYANELVQLVASGLATSRYSEVKI